MLVEHKENCLITNLIKLRSALIKFKSHFKQLAVQFQTFADFKSDSKGIKSNDRNNNASYTELYQAHIPCSFSYKALCNDGKFRKPVVLYTGKNSVNKSIEAIPIEYDYCKNLIKKLF